MRSLIAILCAALVAGCGDDDEEETTVVEPTTVTQTQTQTVTQTESVPAPPGGTDRPLDCGEVAYQAQTDSGAFGIEATGADCETARRVARAAQGEGDDGRYSARGFTCTGERREAQAALLSVAWTCTRADGASVTFETS